MELKDIRNIGPKTLEKLNAYNIFTIKDLLLSFPKKYYFYNVDNNNAFCGENVCFKCTLASRPVLVKFKGNSKTFVFYILINNRKVKCIIFSGDYLRYKLQIGMQIICYGKYKERENEFVLSNIFFEDFNCKIELDYGYKEINNGLLSRAVSSCLSTGYLLEDYLPLEYQMKYRLLDINKLVQFSHFPKSINDCREVYRRVRYEDFFWYTAELEALKVLRDTEEKQPRNINFTIINEYIANLPYELTVDQKAAINVVLSEINSGKLMNRLIEGDVGSGKSIVSFLSAIAAITAGYQVALMAPTEILAIQHFNNFRKLFPKFSVNILTSSVKEKEKKEILYKLVHGRIDLLVGTHALLQENVIFSKLGLVIIDEQHRFGVNQRRKLIEKFKGVDALYLTATPIPRTLGLTAFGDLDLTLIKSMPKNRKSIITKLISYDKFASLKNILLRHLIVGEQVYIVVPLINENENFDYIDINKAYDIFSEMLPEYRIAKLHGKMKHTDKDIMMNSFKNHDLDVLISTTVIEVGVDVKNATVMVILDADRYGISQIHQLRGRVGRGDIQSYCYLVSKKEQCPRLEILEKTTDGFILAEEDFKIRGPGNFLGEEQSGFGSLNFDFNSKDIKIWQCALEDSKEYVYKYIAKKVDNKKMEALLSEIADKKTKIN